MSKLQNFIDTNRNKRILIFGLGLQGGGVGVVKFFSTFSKEIRVTDIKNEDQLYPSLEKLKDVTAHFTLGRHEEDDILWADIIVVNPDIWNKAPDSPYIQLAVRLNKQLETEAGLFMQLCECPVIGVTGTRGKTTTTLAIAELLEKAGKRIVIGGNLPDSETLLQIKKTETADFAVLELSNFQLRGLHMKQLSPHIGVITSISPDHLSSYPNMETYVTDKKAIYLYQREGDYLVFFDDGQWSEVFAREAHSQMHRFSQSTIPQDWHLNITGNHNRQNMGAVLTVGKILGITDEVIFQAVTGFKGASFRLETIVEHNGVKFINDTTATTPTAATIALNSFPEGKIIWIAGGNTKNLPQDELVRTAAHSVKKLILLAGTGTDQFLKDLQSVMNNWSDVYLGTYADFKAAIEKACSVASPGDVVLLSPGFTSFGMFANEFERGREFNRIVQEVIAGDPHGTQEASIG